MNENSFTGRWKIKRQSLAGYLIVFFVETKIFQTPIRDSLVRQCGRYKANWIQWLARRKLDEISSKRERAFTRRIRRRSIYAKRNFSAELMKHAEAPRRNGTRLEFFFPVIQSAGNFTLETFAIFQSRFHYATRNSLTELSTVREIF